jgi:histidine phosphotransferase ChpT
MANEMLIDLRLLELLASKICHDLISPVGAINNGIELVEDIGGSVVNEAMKLISTSAQQAAKRLRLFRMAYGKAGAEKGVTLKDMRNTAKDYLSTSKSKLTWGEEQAFNDVAEQKGALKMVLCLTMLAEDVLSHGGDVTVETVTEPGKIGVKVTIAGTHAQLSEAMHQALKGETTIEDVSPRTVHAYVTGRMIDFYGFKINVTQHNEQLLTLILMPVESANTIDLAHADL